MVFLYFVGHSLFLSNFVAENKMQMTHKPEIAIIEANTLTCIGLRNLIERMMPFAVVRTFNTFEQFVCDTPDMYFHYLIS